MPEKASELRLSLIQHDLSSKYKISSTSLFEYRCTSLSAFCSTWRPTKTMLRIAICCTMLEEKWKIYDKESNVYFNGWNISVGLVNWIDWESMIVFIQSHFTPTGKKILWVDPSPTEIYLFQTPYPLEFLWSSIGGMDIFWNHTI